MQEDGIGVAEGKYLWTPQMEWEYEVTIPAYGEERGDTHVVPGGSHGLKGGNPSIFFRSYPPPPGDTFQFNDTMCKGFVETSIDRGVEGG